MFTVSAAADDAWLKFNGATGLSFEYDCDRETGGDNETCELCECRKRYKGRYRGRQGFLTGEFPELLG